MPDVSVAQYQLSTLGDIGGKLGCYAEYIWRTRIYFYTCAPTKLISRRNNSLCCIYVYLTGMQISRMHQLGVNIWYMKNKFSTMNEGQEKLHVEPMFFTWF